MPPRVSGNVSPYYDIGEHELQHDEQQQQQQQQQLKYQLLCERSRQRNQMFTKKYLAIRNETEASSSSSPCTQTEESKIASTTMVITKPQVCRKLFGRSKTSNTNNENDEITAINNKLLEEKKRRWGFDFVNDTPVKEDASDSNW
eukprot:Pgem_evm1s20141